MTKMCYQKNTIFLIDDNPDGTMLVGCSECGKQFNNKEQEFPPNIIIGKLYYRCPNKGCEAILQYPEGVDW